MSEEVLRGCYWAGVIVFALAVWVASMSWPELGTTLVELKDVITIIVSISAFLISVGVAFFNWWSWRQKNIADANKGLTDALIGMIGRSSKNSDLSLERNI